VKWDRRGTVRDRWGSPGIRLRTAFALAALGTAGCAFLEPAVDPSRFFVLTAVSQPAAAGSGVSIGVGPLHLASYLSVPEIQVRASAAEIVRSPVNRWAEPLEEGLLRVLAQDLSAELGTRDVVLFPWYAEQQPAVQVSASIRRFELDPDGAGVLEARFEVAHLGAGGRRVVRDVAIRKPPAKTDVADSVGALSEAVAELAKEIAKDVR